MNLLTLTGILVAAAVVLQDRTPTDPVEFAGRGYTLLLANDLKTEKQTKADFEVTTIKLANGAPIVGVYSGLHPDFGSDAPRSALYTKGAINGLRSERLAWKNSANEECAEVLVVLRSSPPLTLSAHFFYCLASEENRALAESIIQSVRLERTKMALIRFGGRVN